MQIEFMALQLLTPYARNSRTHSDEQVAQIAASIREFGFTNPVLIDEHDGIIAGHGRVMAAQRLQLTDVPCIRLAHLTEAQKRAYVIADNKLALNAGWDDDALAAEMAWLKEQEYDLQLTGFVGDELDQLLALSLATPKGKTGPDDAPILEDKAISRFGDVWNIGNHRLICGDSTDVDCLRILMAGSMADACWTDPPYNVAYETDAGKIDNDNLSDGDFKKFLSGFYRATHSVMKKGAAIYVAHADTERANFTSEFLAAGFKLSGVVIWRKDSLVLGRSDYQWIHEPILYGWKEGGGAQVFRWSQANNADGTWERRLAFCKARRWKVADNAGRGNDYRRRRCDGGICRGLDHA